MCIPVQWDDDDFYISTTLADAQRALDAEREKVRGIKADTHSMIDVATNRLKEELDDAQARYDTLNVERNKLDDARHTLTIQLDNTIEAAAEQQGELSETQSLARRLQAEVIDLQSELATLQAQLAAWRSGLTPAGVERE